MGERWLSPPCVLEHLWGNGSGCSIHDNGLRPCRPDSNVANRSLGPVWRSQHESVVRGQDTCPTPASLLRSLEPEGANLGINYGLRVISRISDHTLGIDVFCRLYRAPRSFRRPRNFQGRGLLIPPKRAEPGSVAVFTTLALHHTLYGAQPVE